MLIGLLVSLPSADAWGQCPGDCNGDGRVTAGELTKIIAIINYCPCAGALPGGAADGCAVIAGPDTQCVNADYDGNGCITAGELTRVIADILSLPGGCPPAGTATNTPPTPPTFTPTVAVPSNTPTDTPTDTPASTVAATSTGTKTSTPTNTPPPTNTPSGTATPTEAPHAPICGNGIVDAGEDCDDGGICIGTSNAGTPCTSDADCTGPGGVCVDSTNAGMFCTDDTGCPGGQCVKCKPFGGDGCAANCTTETSVPVTLVPGNPQVNPGPGTSLARVLSEAFPNFALPLKGTQTLVIGRKINDRIAVVIPAASVVFPAIPIGPLACGCPRGIAAKTCGGTLLEPDGTISTDCTLADNCATVGKNPCAFVHGPGNAAAGVIGCTALDGVDITLTQDAGGIPEPPAPTPPAGSTLPNIMWSGAGAPGSARIPYTFRVGLVALVPQAPGQTKPCEVPTPGQRVTEYGPDGKYCTPDDPETQLSRGAPQTLETTTETATAEMFNHFITGSGKTGNIGPTSIDGHAFSCSTLTGGTPSATGAGLAGAFTLLNQPKPISDAIVTFVFYLQ